MKAERVACELALPADFRLQEALAFHRRDRTQLAERAGLDEGGGRGRLEKAFMRDGQAVLLDAVFEPGRLRAAVLIEGERCGPAGGELDQPACTALLAHMFGLTQPVAAFERRHRDHPELGGLIRRNAGLRVVQVATPFEALSWAIIGQQISLGAAIALRRRFIEALGREHGAGLRCYPDAAAVAGAEPGLLRSLGLSQTKVQALLVMAQAVSAGTLPLQGWLTTLSGAEAERAAALVDEIRAALLAIRGIGPWTLNYTLLRGFGWLDGGLEGDVAVRRGLQRLLGLEAPPSERSARAWLAAFQPWRALVAAHLWTLSGPQQP